MKQSIRRHLHHLFVPHEKNNHRSKLLHNASLLIMILSVITLASVSHLIKTSAPDVLGISYSISESELLRDTNIKRAENGLAPLSVNNQLTEAAGQKATHMMAHNYWAHFAPDGTTPWSFMRGNGYEYVYAGENLAKGFTDSATIVDAWMKSPSHRENLLSPKYNEIGFAILEGNLAGEDTVLVVQMFGATESSIALAKSNPIPQNNVAQGELSGARQGEVQPVKTQDLEGMPEAVIQNSPLIDINQTSQIIVLVILSTILFALLIDFVIVGKKKIPRMVGNNIDHILLLAIFIILVLLQSTGGVL